MQWSAECPELQQLPIADGWYRLTVYTSRPSSGILGDNQAIDIHFEGDAGEAHIALGRSAGPLRLKRLFRAPETFTGKIESARRARRLSKRGGSAQRIVLRSARIQALE